jgi:hypothetical protein
MGMGSGRGIAEAETRQYSVHEDLLSGRAVRVISGRPSLAAKRAPSLSSDGAISSALVAPPQRLRLYLGVQGA